MPNEEPLVITVEEFARRIGVKPSHAYRLARDGLIPAIKLGRLYRIPATLPERMLAKALEHDAA